MCIRDRSCTTRGRRPPTSSPWADRSCSFPCPPTVGRPSTTCPSDGGRLGSSLGQTVGRVSLLPYRNQAPQFQTKTFSASVWTDVVSEFGRVSLWPNRQYVLPWP